MRIFHEQRPFHHPSRHGYATVLPRESINGSDADVVDANVDVVNTMYAELLDIEEIAPNCTAQLLR